MRKVQRWASSLVFDEYRLYAGEKSRQIDELFMDLFDETELQEEWYEPHMGKPLIKIAKGFDDGNSPSGPYVHPDKGRNAPFRRTPINHDDPIIYFNMQDGSQDEFYRDLKGKFSDIRIDGEYANATEGIAKDSSSSYAGEFD
jgi:Tyrosine phosphatase family